MGKWHDRKPDIERMVAARLTDEQIGTVYGVSGATVCTVRKKLGIAAVERKRGLMYRQQLAGNAAPAEPVPVETYVDADGRRVKRYPPRYAAGAGVQTVTARPRRG